MLTDDDARAAYDTARGAAALRREQAERMGTERRRFRDELEEAERRAREGRRSAPPGGAAATADGERKRYARPGAGGLRSASGRSGKPRRRRRTSARGRSRGG